MFFGGKNAQLVPFVPFVPGDREGRPYISCRSGQGTWADESAVCAINRHLRDWVGRWFARVRVSAKIVCAPVEVWL
jgi:hypothetical protein